MIELGEYNLSNSNLIDRNNSSENNVSILTHEEVHRNLCGASSYGLLVIMMNKNKHFESSNDWLLDNLVAKMSKMQEKIATTIEYITIHEEQGKEEYIKKKKELKNNKTYYNYFRKLLTSSMGINSDTIKILYNIGVLSLNINLNDIPFQDFTDEKDFHRFLSVEGNNFRYLPNIRFNTLFRLYFREIDVNEIEKELEYISEGTVSLEDTTKCAREAFKRIYSKSKFLHQMKERIMTIQKTDICLDDIYEGVSTKFMSANPSDLNNTSKGKYNVCYLEYEKFWEKFDEYDKNNVVIRFEQLLGGFENIAVISLCDLKNSLMYVANYPVELFDECVEKSNCPIMFINTKLFGRVKDRIRRLSLYKPIYLFMDGEILSKIEFIHKNFKGGNYTYFHCENYVTLIIFRRSYVLIQFIIVNLVKELDNLLWETENIKFIEYEKASLNKELLNTISDETMKFSSYAYRMKNMK